MGSVFYADDIILLSGSRNGLQSLVNICSEFASERNLTFGTDEDPRKSKSKCIVFSKNEIVGVKNITLYGRCLPWVDQLKYLGSILEYNNSMTQDISNKRGIFIGIVNSLLQEFHSSSPTVLMKLISSYAISLYGSSTWNLFSKDCDRLYNSWNVCVRNVFNIDRKTHRRLIEPISSSPHLKTLLLARQKDFFERVMCSKKFEVRFIANLIITHFPDKVKIDNTHESWNLDWLFFLLHKLSVKSFET